MWQLVVGFNAVIALCYLAISALILRGLVRTHQVRTNALALATAAIFFTCAFHHASHASHLLLTFDRTSGGMGGSALQDMRQMMGAWPYVVIDAIGAVVAVVYLSLRRSYGSLLGRPSMFADASDTAYRQLAANLPHSTVSVLDRDLRYTLVEGSGASGYDLSTFLGRRAEDVLTASDWLRTGHRLQAALEGRTAEFTMSFSTGRTFSVRTVPMRDDSGEVIGVLSVAEDVTEQRETAAQRNDAQAFTEAVLAASPDVTIAVDLATGEEVWSSRSVQTALPWAGLRPGETPPPVRRRIVDPEDLERLLEDDRRLAGLPDGESVSSRFQVDDGAGGRRWVARRATPFARDADGVPRQALCVVRDITDTVQAEQHLRHAALHDPLTGLPNRSLMVELVASASARHSRTGENVVLLFCDLDGFKEVNDTHGHAVGDALLVEIAHRLRQALRSSDSVARVGGDEFVVILEPQHQGELDGPARDVAAAEMLAERIRRAIAVPFEHDSAQVAVTASVGMATLRPGTSPDETLREADAAMYRAKQRGRDRVEVFDSELRSDSLERRRIEKTIRRALEEHPGGQSGGQSGQQSGQAGGAGLRVAYQPIIDLHGRRLVGFEALARLTDPLGRDVPPDLFIPVAEATGMIDDLGEIVLDDALAALRAWRSQQPAGSGEATAPVTMSVNLTARQAQSERLLPAVEAGLTRHGLAPADLVLELTESVLLESGPATLRRMAELHDRGVRIAVDDFGSGYASLRYLATLPVDLVKIDGAFTAGFRIDERSTAIVDAAAALAEQLGIGCVVEGVETLEQLEGLPVGVLGQGYLLGRPAEELTTPEDPRPLAVS